MKFDFCVKMKEVENVFANLIHGNMLTPTYIVFLLVCLFWFLYKAYKTSYKINGKYSEGIHLQLTEITNMQVSSLQNASCCYESIAAHTEELTVYV